VVHGRLHTILACNTRHFLQNDGKHKEGTPQRALGRITIELGGSLLHVLREWVAPALTALLNTQLPQIFT